MDEFNNMTRTLMVFDMAMGSPQANTKTAVVVAPKPPEGGPDGTAFVGMYVSFLALGLYLSFGRQK